MFEENVLYTIGLILASLYIVMGLDDFIWDIVTTVRSLFVHPEKLDLHNLDTTPPKLLAVAIAAWREDNVIGDVIENFIASTQYPKSMYYIFLGVYPNDEPTKDIVQKLAEQHENIRMIVNYLPGPTSKAQNINYVIRQIKEFEEKHLWQFAAITIHDSEDVVHPYELKVTNYLIDRYPALQFPVFPIIAMPRFTNFFKQLTTGTYLDEFAENHFMTMVTRYRIGAFVPSAGTGFALSHKTIESFGDEDVLPRDSLTEDYRLSLTLYERGIQMCYVMERLPRIDDNQKIVWDYISTRSIFPKTFKAAVKQKTRWILGITMQSIKLKEVIQAKGMSLIGRYSLYKDLKAKVGNMLVVVGYPVLIYFLASLFWPLTPIYPLFTLSWYLSVVITVMMIERQLFRAFCIYNVYGIRSMFFSCFLPPVLPIRLVWGNIINFVATSRAYKQYFGGNQTPQKKEKKITQMKVKENAKQKKFTWAKTDHDFLDQKALRRYHRKIGDILLEKGYISLDDLQRALREKEDRLLGSYLLDNHLITEQQLLNAMAYNKHIQFIEPESLSEYNFSDFRNNFDEQFMRSIATLPILKTSTGYVFAYCEDSPQDAQARIRERYGITTSSAFASRETIEKGLAYIYQPSVSAKDNSITATMYLEGRLTFEQVIVIRNYKSLNKLQNEDELLNYMGLLPVERVT